MSLNVRTVNDLFNAAFTDLHNIYVPEATKEYYVGSTESDYYVEVPLVGVAKENISIEVQDNVMTIKANNDLKSRFAKMFKQSWQLANDVDIERINARLEHGLLTVSVPRIKPVKKVVSVTIN